MSTERFLQEMKDPTPPRDAAASDLMFVKSALTILADSPDPCMFGSETINSLTGEALRALERVEAYFTACRSQGKEAPGNGQG